MRDTGIADRLRTAGLKVVEVDGWRTRGSEDFDPRGSVDHHTAGGRSGNAPSLGICINGRPDLPGPLCHVLIGRDNTCYVIAAGRANHAGSGGWDGLSRNRDVYGIERENVGTPAEPWRPDQTDVAARAHRALAADRFTSRRLCRHAEWAPTRKVDTHSISGSALRAAFAAPIPPPTPPPALEEDDAMLITRQDNPTQALLFIGGALFKGHSGAITGSTSTPKVSVHPDVWNALIKKHGPVIG